MKDVLSLGINDLSSLLSKREISSVELTSLFLEKISNEDKNIFAYLFVDSDGALRSAKMSDYRRAKNEAFGILDGIPFSVKDNFCTKNIPTTCGSRMLEGYTPPYTATVIDHLLSKGAVLLGKTNMDEFGMGSLCMNSYFGVTKNPTDLSRAAGGSSGGSAASVKSGEAVFSIGSDTGGSVRLPAALCGVVGFKPSYGALSRYGLTAFAPSLDTVGILSGTSEDALSVFENIKGKDPLDATSFDFPKEKIAKSSDKIHVGIIKELHDMPLSKEVKAAYDDTINELSELGAEVSFVSVPSINKSAPCYYIISSAEASSTLSRFDGVRYGYRAKEIKNIDELYRKSRSEGFGKEVKKRIMLGSFALSHEQSERYYKNALLCRERLCCELEYAFESFDVLITPLHSNTAPLLSSPPTPEELYKEDVFTSFANLCRIPAISLPRYKNGELPVGIQLLANKGNEDVLFTLAKILEGREL